LLQAIKYSNSKENNIPLAWLSHL